MAGWWRQAAALAAIAAAVAGRADDDVPAFEPAPAEQRSVARPGIDLAAHVDLNVTLRDNDWRLGGGVQHVVIGGHGPLVFDGNLTIGGGTVQEPAERIRRTDEFVLVRLRQAQRDTLAALAGDPLVSAARLRALELATEADIRRVTAEIVRLRDRYAGRHANLGDEAWQTFQRDVRRCRRSIADPFGADSLFAAVRAGFAAADTDP